jgi:hypothetical protein
MPRLARAVGDRKSRFTPQVDVEDRAVHIRVLDRFDSTLQGFSRPNDYGTPSGNFARDIRGDDNSPSAIRMRLPASACVIAVAPASSARIMRRQ